MKATDVEGHCRRNHSGYSAWDPKLLEGRPESWRESGEKAAGWTIEERERVLEALEETPEFLKDANIHGIYRLKEAKMIEPLNRITF